MALSVVPKRGPSHKSSCCCDHDRSFSWKYKLVRDSEEKYEPRQYIHSADMSYSQ